MLRKCDGGGERIKMNRYGNKKSIDIYYESVTKGLRNLNINTI